MILKSSPSAKASISIVVSSEKLNFFFADSQQIFNLLIAF